MSTQYPSLIWQGYAPSPCTTLKTLRGRSSLTGEGFPITRRGILLWSRNLTSSWRIGLWDTWKIASLGNISRRSSGIGGTSPSGDPRMRGN